MPFVVSCSSFASPEGYGANLGGMWRTPPGVEEPWVGASDTQESQRAVDTSVWLTELTLPMSCQILSSLEVVRVFCFWPISENICFLC